MMCLCVVCGVWRDVIWCCVLCVLIVSCCVMSYDSFWGVFCFCLCVRVFCV